MFTFGLLLSGLACTSSKEGSADDTEGRESGAVDTAVVDSGDVDTSVPDTSDTSDTGGGDPANRSPLADCTADIVDTNGFVGTVAYDAGGRVVSTRYDDGRRVVAHGYTYDAGGRILAYTKDVGGDGSIDERGDYTYDGYGKLVVSTVADASGVVVITVSYLYDAAGNAVTTTYLSPSTTYVQQATYDGHANPLVVTYDYGMDGSVDSRTENRYTYDAAGRMALQEVDNDRDGAFEVQVTYGYDAAGRRVSMDSVTVYGGTTTTSNFTWVYNTDGWLVAQTFQDARGAADFATFAHDARGRVIEETHDYAPLGSVDVVTTTTFTCP